ncbi:hypothetical protein BV25DRAFT_1838760 [Artomyces pyxidatus]|uniref:Uncharacterized protein n=1 Tax=Artomyces pyxidatus TaxID=48021 RepID=A0ACB8T1B1_9AGAM|nr:hypothetical protein BV25DRAFT_1838760 [Artomyces pyxidatus]
MARHGRSREAATVFPVHDALPNPDRYRDWVKQRGALIWGLPLWSRKELIAGRQESEKGHQEGTPATDDECTQYAWDARTFSLEQRRLEMEDEGEFDGSHIPTPAHGVLEVMLDLATRKVGLPARDVYSALECDPSSSAAIDGLSYRSLSKLVVSSAQEPSAHGDIVAASPTVLVSLYKHDTFTVNFKSPDIAIRVLERLRNAEHMRLTKFFGLLRRYSKATNLAVDAKKGQGVPTATLWVFQMTTATTHRSSPDGYLVIRSVIREVRERLEALREPRDEMAEADTK